MFLNSKQQKAVEFAITILEARGLIVDLPTIEIDGNKAQIAEIKWLATTEESGKIKAHIILTRWVGKSKVIIWLPKNPDKETILDIDSYVVSALHTSRLILPNEGQVSLNKTDPNMFMTLEEMRDYLRY